MSDDVTNSPSPSLALIYPLAFGVCLIASYLLADFFIRLKDGWGSSDMGAFIFWTFPFAVALMIVAIPFVKLLGYLSLEKRIVAAVLTGWLSSLIWTFIVALLLGGWFAAFSFPVLYCWMAGGVSAMVVVAVFASKVARLYR